jgi:hypothetical protein
MSKEQNHPPRGLASATYSGLAVVGLAAIALVSAAAAQAVQPGSAQAGPVRPASAAARGEQGEPPAGTRAESRRLARRLLARAVLPRGARVYRGRQVPGGLRGPGTLIVATASVDVHADFTESQSMNAAIAYLSRHHPAGMSAQGTGETYRTDHGHQVALEKNITYVPDHLGRAYFAVQLVVEVAPGKNGHSLSRADVQVTWFPRRPAAEHVVAKDVRAVRIDAFLAGGQPLSGTQRTFRQRAIIDKVARIYDAVPGSPGGWESCPVITETYAITFEPVAGDPEVSAVVPGCFSYLVTVSGHPEPSLFDNGSLEKIAHSLTETLKHGGKVSPLRPQSPPDRSAD